MIHPSRRTSSDSAELKLKRASKRIDELNAFLAEERPFSYVLQTNTVTGERATLAKKNQAVADEAALIAGDAVHNIRTALDHAYWEIVSPFATTPKEQRAVQFPFCEKAASLDGAVKNRLANRVSAQFFDAVKGLKPYGEEGGNALLYAIDLLDIPDKHRLLVPVADYKQIDCANLRRQVPDFPTMIEGTVSISACGKDIVWHTGGTIPAEHLGQLMPPTYFMFEKELNVPVEIVINIASLHFNGPIVPTLNKLVEVGRETIRIIRKAAKA